MSRALSSTFVEAVNAAETDEAFLVLVKIDDADLSDPVRVTSDSVKTVKPDPDSSPDQSIGTAADSTSNNNDGTLVNDPQWTTDEVTDQIVGALSFDGVDDQVDLSSLIEITGDFTVSMWVNLDDDGDFGPAGQMLVAEDGVESTFIRIRNTDEVEVATKDDNETRATWANTGVDFTQWHHLSLTRSGSSVELFIDGQSYGTDSLSNAITIDTFGTGWSDDNYRTKGLLSDARIWNTARTQSEIQDNMNKRLTGTETGLAGYWRLDDGLNKDYQPFPFKVELPDDTDDMGGALARLRMDAVDRRVVEAVRRVSGVPEVTLEVVLASDPDTVEVSWPTFSLSNARYGDQTVEADLTLEVLDQEPFPGDSMNPALFPGMY